MALTIAERSLGADMPSVSLYTHSTVKMRAALWGEDMSNSSGLMICKAPLKAERDNFPLTSSVWLSESPPAPLVPPEAALTVCFTLFHKALA
jgi:hypothetical protein